MAIKQPGAFLPLMPQLWCFKNKSRLGSISKCHYMGVVMLRPQRRLMCYLCDSEELISDSVASASAMCDFVIQHSEESLRNKHQK